MDFQLLVSFESIFFFEACHDSCEFECTGPGDKACHACRNGYEMVDGGCKGYKLSFLLLVLKR